MMLSVWAHNASVVTMSSRSGRQGLARSRPFDPARPIGTFFNDLVEVLLANQGGDEVVVAITTEILEFEDTGEVSATHQVFEVGMTDGEQECFHFVIVSKRAGYPHRDLIRQPQASRPTMALDLPRHRFSGNFQGRRGQTN